MTSAFDGPLRAFRSVLLVACLLSSRALATDEYVETETRTAARALAAQGSAAYEARDFERALSLFERAGAIIPAPTISLMQARTLVELGRLVEAVDKYTQAVRMRDLDATNSAFRDAANAAQREVEQVLQRIPTLRVRLIAFSPASNPQITIDGRRIMPALAAVDRPIDPGVHRVVVRTTQGVVVREIKLAERQHEDVVVSPPAPTRAARAEPARDSAAAGTPERPSAESSNTQRMFGWVIGGAGAGLVGMGAVTGVMALNHKADLDAVCRPGCPATSAGDIDAFRLERTLSYAGFGVGAAALAGGAVILWQAPARAEVALSVGPRAITMAGRFP